MAKNPLVSARNAADLGSFPGSGRSPGGGNGSPLQYSCLEHPMDRGAWRATVHGVAELDTTERAHASHPLLYIELAKKFFWFFPEDVTEKPNRAFLVSLIQARAYINAQSERCACGRAETQTESLCVCCPAACLCLERTKPRGAWPCAEIFTTCVRCRGPRAAATAPARVGTLSTPEGQASSSGGRVPLCEVRGWERGRRGC